MTETDNPKPHAYTPPEPAEKGPDGQGWNRLSLCGQFYPRSQRCMLAPLDGLTARELHRLGWVALRELASSRFGLCTGDACDRCPRALLSRHRRDLASPSFARNPIPSHPRVEIREGSTTLLGPGFRGAYLRDGGWPEVAAEFWIVMHEPQPDGWIRIA